MLDIKLLKENPVEVVKCLVRRGLEKQELEETLEEFKDLIHERNKLLSEVEGFKNRRNVVSREIGKVKQEGGDTSVLLKEMQGIPEGIKLLDKDVAAKDESLKDLLLNLPNIPHELVPSGTSEEENIELKDKKSGEIRTFSFDPKDHVKIGEDLGILDFNRGSKLAGARFSLYKGQGAHLERALINFMLDMHTKHHGYLEILPPFMVNKKSMIGTGQLPKFEDDLFKIDGWDHYLIPTAEVPLTNIFQDEILEEKELPIYYTAYTPCFRKEAGSHGVDTRGLIRQHQFNKVELVKFTTPEKSYDELDSLLKNAEEVLKQLELPYRVMMLCAGDLGFSAAKTYDIEVWVPSQEKYREISSCSNFEAFQARRAGIRYRPESGGKPRFVHTVNGSGLAVGRTVVAILENFQQEDGSVIIPKVLRSYMGRAEKIEKESKCLRV